MIKDSLQKPEINFWAGLLMPLLGVAVAWGVFTNRVENLDTRLNYFGDRQVKYQADCEKVFDEQDKVFLEIQVTLAEIQKDILYIKQALD